MEVVRAGISHPPFQKGGGPETPAHPSTRQDTHQLGQQLVGGDPNAQNDPQLSPAGVAYGTAQPDPRRQVPLLRVIFVRITAGITAAGCSRGLGSSKGCVGCSGRGGDMGGDGGGGGDMGGDGGGAEGMA